MISQAMTLTAYSSLYGVLSGYSTTHAMYAELTDLESYLATLYKVSSEHKDTSSRIFMSHGEQDMNPAGVMVNDLNIIDKIRKTYRVPAGMPAANFSTHTVGLMSIRIEPDEDEVLTQADVHSLTRADMASSSTLSRLELSTRMSQAELTERYVLEQSTIRMNLHGRNIPLTVMASPQDLQISVVNGNDDLRATIPVRPLPVTRGLTSRAMLHSSILAKDLYYNHGETLKVYIDAVRHLKLLLVRVLKGGAINTAKEDAKSVMKDILESINQHPEGVSRPSFPTMYSAERYINDSLGLVSSRDFENEHWRSSPTRTTYKPLSRRPEQKRTLKVIHGDLYRTLCNETRSSIGVPRVLSHSPGSYTDESKIVTCGEASYAQALCGLEMMRSQYLCSYQHLFKGRPNGGMPHVLFAGQHPARLPLTFQTSRAMSVPILLRLAVAIQWIGRMHPANIDETVKMLKMQVQG